MVNSQSIPHQDDVTHDNNKNSFNYVGMEIGLQRDGDDQSQFAKVTKEVLDDEGKPLGIGNDNPFLDGRMYEVKYLDSTTEVLAANTIAENIMAQVDDNGHRQLLLNEIVDHCTNSEALTTKASLITHINKVPTRKRTTKG